ncbi:hypothetical protein JCM9279_005643 [Rhodotorula babjevae]
MSSSGSPQGSAEPTSRATSLLDLPDELLADIFQAVYDSESDNIRHSDQTFFIRICKRIYNLALPIWMSHVELRMPSTPGAVTNLVNNVRSSAYAKAKDVVIFCSLQGLPSSVADVLISFPNVKSLRFDTIATPDADGMIPLRASNVLTMMRSLNQLELDPDVSFEDQAFDLRTTSVRVLVLDTIDHTMLRHGRGGGLDTLIIDSYTLEGCAVPWCTLRTLRLRGGAEGIIEGVATILPSLETAVGSGPVPLNTFELAIEGHVFPAGFDDVAHRSEQYQVMYTVLQLAKPQVLRVAHVLYSPLGPPARVGPFSSVVKLDLEADISLVDLCRSLDAGLVAFLRLFPSMTDFYLACSGHPNSLVADYIDMSPATFSARHPSFAGLVVLLKTTLVLRFEYRSAVEPLFLRYTRATADDDFTAEAWQKG